ncbi:MAG: lamin tail domain-containing protein [Candidatus Marinimicrobia bacterium]|nr:lamin tail domain-containing protein [Candidatus Neomarinimicrobiota bacterium]
MMKINVCILNVIIATVGFCQTVWINELMINPLYSENSAEFVEILNKGDQSVNLKNWCFGDKGDMDFFVFLGDSILHAGQYGLILDLDYSGEYDFLIPDSTLIMIIEDSRFGGYGLSNTVEKFYFLQNSEGIIADSCLSIITLKEGFSMERDEQGGWRGSNVEGGTPGFVNSICRPSFPLLSVLLKDYFLGEPADVFLSLIIKNLGNEVSGEWEISFIDSITQQFLWSTGPQEELAGNDSLPVKCAWHSPLYGFQRIKWVCQYGDRDTSGKFTIYIPLPVDSLFITEFCPLPGNEISCEYIEIYNASHRPINLYGTTIKDKTGTAQLANFDYIIPELGLRVAAESPEIRQDLQSPPFLVWIPPAWRSLNNTGDQIVWKDSRGIKLDSLEYTSQWNVAMGLGLERRSIYRPAHDKNNWVQGFSPGLDNLETHADTSWDARLTVKRKVFDEITFQITLENTGRFPVIPPDISLVARSPDGVNQTIDHLTFSKVCDPGQMLKDSITVYSKFSGTFLWMLSGKFLMSDTLSVYTPYPQSPVVFSEVMNCPSSDEPAEWIELFSHVCPIILDDWSMYIDEKEISLKGSITTPYIVISHKKWDNFFMDIAVDIFPSLLNKGFILRLFDPDSTLMDSVDLTNHPEFLTGVSLENPSVIEPFMSGSSWHRSRAQQGHTAGKVNSIAIDQNEGDSFITVNPRVLKKNAIQPMAITLQGEKGFSYAEIHIFTLTGNPVRTYEKNAFSAPLLQVFWDGTLTNGMDVPLGLYIIVAKARYVDGSKQEGFKSVLVNCY